MSSRVKHFVLKPEQSCPGRAKRRDMVFLYLLIKPSVLWPEIPTACLQGNRNVLLPLFLLYQPLLFTTTSNISETFKNAKMWRRNVYLFFAFSNRETCIFSLQDLHYFTLMLRVSTGLRLHQKILFHRSELFQAQSDLFCLELLPSQECTAVE